MTTPASKLVPPFTREIAIAKVRMAENAWNSRDPDRVSMAYTEDSFWRTSALSRLKL
jgi:nuclear transport factor 2 (NTF2) superfamily protein